MTLFLFGGERGTTFEQYSSCIKGYLRVLLMVYMQRSSFSTG